MSDRKFICPACGQKIACEETMGGRQIKCPACQAEIIIPQFAPAPAPAPAPASAPASAQAPAPARVRLTATPPTGAPKPASPPPPAVPTSSGLKLSAVHAAPAAASPPSAPAAPAGPSRPVAVPQPARSSASASRPAAPARFEIPDDDGDKPNKGKKIAVIAGVVVAVGLAAFFGIPALIAMQNKLNVEREKNLEERDGGELGHLAELNSVLDATDPAKFEHISVREDFDRAPAGPRPDTTPVIPPTWTLSASPANIPNGRVNGMIAGGKFVADAVRLDPVGNRHLLTLRQGANVYADRELLIYLKLSPGEGLEGKTWTVTQDMRTGAPQVVKRWVADANRPPQSKPFPNGYAMVLEFGKFKDGNLPGKVFVALPDAEKTVVGGTFKAIVGVPERPEARLGLGMDE